MRSRYLDLRWDRLIERSRNTSDRGGFTSPSYCFCSEHNETLTIDDLCLPMCNLRGVGEQNFPTRIWVLARIYFMYGLFETDLDACGFKILLKLVRAHYH